MENKTKLIIQIPDSVIRNTDNKIDCTTFSIYTYLTFLHFRNYKEDTIKLDHNKFKHKLYITDNRTFKKALTTLHKQGLILEYIDKLPTKGALTVTFNPVPLDKGKFTQLPATIFNFMEHIGTVGLRLLFFYESYINRTDPITEQFAYPAIETTAAILGINKDTVIKYNNLLIKHNLIKVTKHEIEHTGEYNNLDEPIFTKYNNHYYVNVGKM